MKRIILMALFIMALCVPIVATAGPVDWCLLALAEDWQNPSWSMNCFNMSAYDGHEDDDIVMINPASTDAAEMINQVEIWNDETNIDTTQWAAEAEVTYYRTTETWRTANRFTNQNTDHCTYTAAETPAPFHVRS